MGQQPQGSLLPQHPVHLQQLGQLRRTRKVAPPGASSNQSAMHTLAQKRERQEGPRLGREHLPLSKASAPAAAHSPCMAGAPRVQARPGVPLRAPLVQGLGLQACSMLQQQVERPLLQRLLLLLDHRQRCAMLLVQAQVAQPLRCRGACQEETMVQLPSSPTGTSPHTLALQLQYHWAQQ